VDAQPLSFCMERTISNLDQSVLPIISDCRRANQKEPLRCNELRRNPHRLQATAVTRPTQPRPVESPNPATKESPKKQIRMSGHDSWSDCRVIRGLLTISMERPQKGPGGCDTESLDGTFTVNLHWGFGGARFATAGVGLALRAGATGVAHVRPSWAYDYQGIAYGSNLSSHTEGTAKVIVQDAVTGAVLKEVTRPLWHFDNDRREDGDSFIDSWALGVDVFIQAGQRFTASFLATAMVDDSGTDFLFGWSLAKAHLQMRTPFVGVELGP